MGYLTFKFTDALLLLGQRRQLASAPAMDTDPFVQSGVTNAQLASHFLDGAFS
jgi:hypothetical protein